MITREAIQTGIQPRARLTVYLVEDDAAIRDAISLALSLRGYQIAQFSSAEGFFDAFDASWAGPDSRVAKSYARYGLLSATKNGQPWLPAVRARLISSNPAGPRSEIGRAHV